VISMMDSCTPAPGRRPQSFAFSEPALGEFHVAHNKKLRPKRTRHLVALLHGLAVAGVERYRSRETAGRTSWAIEFKGAGIGC
jgi:hypothetical protein